jgi:DNA-binding transcriptional regulator YiaG
VALLNQENGVDRRQANLRGKTPAYAKMPRAGRVIIDPAKLRYWRHARVMTRAQLAAASRLSPETIRSYEAGRRFPRESAFRRLFTALGIEPADLLFDDCRYIRSDNPKENEDG